MQLIPVGLSCSTTKPHCCLPLQGGLSLTPDEIALPVSFAGLGLVLFALLLYPRIQKRLGCLACAKVGLILAIPLALVIPMSSFAAPQ